MTSDQPSLPADRAFVVQLHADSNPEQQDFRGRVEHPASLQTAHFTSLEELAAFIARTLSAQELAEAVHVQEDEV